MWYMIIFTGRWDVAFLARASAFQPGEKTAGDKAKTRAAVEARSEVRRAKNLLRLMQKGNNKAKGKWLDVQDSRKRELINKLRDGTLVSQANQLTRESGHGRILRADGSFVDIGGSTGGIVRTILYDWTLPDVPDEEAPPDVPDEEESELMMME